MEAAAAGFQNLPREIVATLEKGRAGRDWLSHIEAKVLLDNMEELETAGMLSDSVHTSPPSGERLLAWVEGGGTNGRLNAVSRG